MAWRYRNRETKEFVSSATYRRSKAQGGMRFERFSSKTLRSVRWRAKPSASTGASAPTQVSLSPSETPKTYEEFKAYMENRIKKMRKSQRERFEEEPFDGPEYETGVDY
jgi:hypothetical protein